MSGAGDGPDPLREAGPLVTAHQLPAVLCERDMFLAACPGSGKTRTAAVRVARLAEEGSRVAVCSYTNTGVEELRRSLAQEVGHTLGPQHFSGTLHRFLLRYVLHPFGQLVLGCAGSPRVLGPDALYWQRDQVVFESPKVRLGLDRFQFRPEGSLCVRTTDLKFPHDPETTVRMRGERARAAKVRLARDSGWVSMDDAMYWALQVLRTYPWVASAITHRFDELLVDEAQDTSELQLACLYELHRTGTLRSLTLIGDLDQSVYSYNGAHPAGCGDLAATRGLKRIELQENRRCSQRICTTVAPLHSRTDPDRAVGPDRDCPLTPEVVLYPAKNPAVALDDFQQRLLALGERPDEAAVMARTNDLVDAINRAGSPPNVNGKALLIARMVHAQRHDTTLGQRELERLDRALVAAAWGEQDLAALPTELRWQVRRAAMIVLHEAPPLEGDFGSWTRELRKPAREALASLTDTPTASVGQWLQIKAAMNNHQVADLAPQAAPVLRAHTIHDLKGTTHASIALVLGKASKKRDPAALLGAALAAPSTAAARSEEIRVSYVALTRARRLCCVALPDDTPDATVALFTSHGFTTSSSG